MYENEVNKLLNLMGIDFNGIVLNWLDETIKNVKEQHPEIPESDLVLFQEAIHKNTDIENLRNQYAAIYKRYFSQDEIVGLIKFYESPLGRKSISANQQITHGSQAIGVAYFESLSNEVIKELVAENS